MPSLQLVDFNTPEGQNRIFSFDPASGRYDMRSVERDSQRFVGSAGWGSLIETGENFTTTMVAFYILNRSINLFINGQTIDADTISSSEIKDNYPDGNIWEMQVGESSELLTFKYKPPSEDDEDDDLILWISNTVTSTFDLKLFAYTWAANAAGVERPTREAEWTVEEMENLEDPYDISQEA